MSIFAISDLHLSFSNPDKSMEFFGPVWKDYPKKIEKNFKEKVTDNDLVLIPGDISWAITLKEALVDLEWIDSLPGKKIIIKGNHDYWVPSKSKLQKALPPSLVYLQNDSYNFNEVSIAAARLWDTDEFNFNEYIDFQENPRSKKDKEQDIQKDLNQKIFLREVERLKLSLNTIDKNAKTKIVMTHYPPISADLKDSMVSKILKENDIDICVFGHLHNVKKEKPMFGTKDDIKYILTSADYIDFDPIKIF